ncbi:hypothetical protein CLU79DRAFT_834083 [Phycomyces nitens]|nr:hypothetical protein CLU79DRAFT_834083 [Phycomyces nitens]
MLMISRNFQRLAQRPLYSTARAYSHKPKDKKELIKDRIPFMPVINIPETDFAHNAFFSLHRPLLGLSSDDERPFFQTLTPQEVEEDAFTQYMMDLRPFEPPSEHAAREREPMVEILETSMSEPLHIDYSLPMFNMPESDEVVNYLTQVQKIMAKQNERTVGRRKRHGRRGPKRNID